MCRTPRHQPIILLLLGLLLWPPQPARAADVPSEPSDVYVQGTQLLVRWRRPDGLLDAPRPYLIRGVTWSPATRAPKDGPNPLDPAQSAPYGFFFDWSGRTPQGSAVLLHWLQSEFRAHLADLALMESLHVNTIRVYAPLDEDPGVSTQILDECYRRGIMVILTVAASKDDLERGRSLQTVEQYKQHPAILMWALGNEWNLNDPPYYGYTVLEARQRTNDAAAQIKLQDTHHPVSSILGDRFVEPPTTCDPGDSCCKPEALQAAQGSSIPAIVAAVPAVDVWGLNVYRGASFGSLFTQWVAATPKPMYLSEFGTDSFATTGYQRLKACGPVVRNVSGSEQPQQQAEVVSALWQELIPHLSAAHASEPLLGGLVHEFNDELWKAGSFHAGLGGVVNYDGPDGVPGTADDDTSYNAYNTEGFLLPGAHPDDVANEEYFGLVDADRRPKAAFSVLRQIYATLVVPAWPPPAASSPSFRLETLSFNVGGSLASNHFHARVTAGEPCVGSFEGPTSRLRGGFLPINFAPPH